MTTRAGPSESKEEEEKSVNIIYSHSHEPWIKYRMSSVTTRAPTLLKDGEVLYLEDNSHRYELCWTGEKVGSTPQERVSVFRFARCKINFSQKRLLKCGVPLPSCLLGDVQDKLEWKDLRWLDTGVVVGGTYYILVRMFYFTPTGVGSNCDSEYTGVVQSELKEEEEEEEKSVIIIYNHCNEPWIKYSMSSITERAPTLLKDGEVLYLEDKSHRYELCWTGEKVGSTPQERVSVFRFGRCRILFSQKRLLKCGVPLPSCLLGDVQELEWKDLRWLDTGVVVGGVYHFLVRMLYLTPSGVGSNCD